MSDIEELRTVHKNVNKFRELVESKFGPPPPLSYIPSGYVGPSEFIRIVTDIDDSINRLRAIIRNLNENNRP